MSDYITIKINVNSDCAGELDAPADMLKSNKGYLYKEFSRREIVEIAVNELYDKLVAEKKNGINQRSI